MHLILEIKETTAMGARKPFTVVMLCCILAVAAAIPAEHVEPAQDGTIATYIVHIASSHSPRTTRNAARLTRSYTSFLRDTLPTGIHEPTPSILYAYAHAMTGFAARLTARQAAHLEAQSSILAVIPDRMSEFTPPCRTKNQGDYATAEPHLLPAVSVSYADAMEIRKYSRTPSPVASFLLFRTSKGAKIPPSPRVASFSSRGPSLVAPEILKPDVIALGIEILAAWTGAQSISTLDTRRVKFNIMSGTSMAAPHVSGMAAMLKVARPTWSPAAIKSALMTTAYNVDNAGGAITDMSTGKKAGPFELGAGHVDPNRALDPGLVYNAGEDDYISFLCALGYTRQQIAIFTGGGVKDDICLEYKDVTVGDHNYPAFSVAFKSYQQEVTQRRVVRNVGSNINAVYTFSLRSYPNNVFVKVYPTKLVFDAQHQTLEYTVTFSLVLSATNNSSPQEVSSAIVWTDSQHTVVSPMIVTWPAPTASVATM
ncbi:unnamed protein product [Alopecurus aequalis]